MTSMRAIVFCGSVVLLATLTGCSRYEYRELCEPWPRTGVSGIGWVQADLPAGTIEGRVIDVQSQPLPASQIALEPGSRYWMPEDGLFRADSLPEGEYTLRVRRIGYSLASQSITLSGGKGVSVLIVMAPDMMILDGCGLTKVRKPWWKFE